MKPTRPFFVLPRRHRRAAVGAGLSTSPGAPGGVRQVAWLALGLLALGPSCSDEPAASGPGEGAFERLADPSRWEWVPQGEDPFVGEASARPTRCGWADVQIESGGLEISTVDCNYATLVQPLDRHLEPGDPLRVVVWWQTLASEAPARAHLELRAEQEPLWRRELDIPAEAGIADEVVVASARHTAGSPLYFHLDNHGYNTWNINRIESRKTP